MVENAKIIQNAEGQIREYVGIAEYDKSSEQTPGVIEIKDPAVTNSKPIQTPRVVIIRSSELMRSENNPTGCWSPKRALCNCESCETFTNALLKSESTDDLRKNLKCVPHFSEYNLLEYFNARKEHREATAKFNKIRETMRRGCSKNGT